MDIKNKMLKDRIALLAGGVLLGLAAPKVSTAVAEKFNDTKDKTEVVSSNQIKQKKLNESLFKALEDGDLEKIKLAIKDGADIEYELKIKYDEDKKYWKKLGHNGMMHFETDYNDKIKSLFDIKDMEEKTKFSTKVADENNNNYDVDCKLFKKYDEQMNSQNLSQQKGKTSYAFYQKVMKDAKQNA